MSKKPILYQGNPDKRLIQRRILNGEINEEDISGYLSSLPDLSDNAEELTVTLEEKH